MKAEDQLARLWEESEKAPKSLRPFCTLTVRLVAGLVGRVAFLEMCRRIERNPDIKGERKARPRSGERRRRQRDMIGPASPPWENDARERYRTWLRRNSRED